MNVNERHIKDNFIYSLSICFVMGNETYLLKEFVKEKNLSDGAEIKKQDLEIYFIDKSKVAYTTLSSYFYILKLLRLIEQTADKKVFKLNKKLLDERSD